MPIYAAYAANGGSYVGDGAAKTATLVAVSSVMCGLFTIARFRFGPLPSVSFFLLSERGRGWRGGALLRVGRRWWGAAEGREAAAARRGAAR